MFITVFLVIFKTQSNGGLFLDRVARESQRRKNGITALDPLCQRDGLRCSYKNDSVETSNSSGEIGKNKGSGHLKFVGSPLQLLGDT